MDIQVEKLHYSVEGRNILDGISLSLKEGQFVGVLGPNGCGKSTLLKHIYRFLPIQEGSIYVNDKNLAEISLQESARDIAVMGQFNHGDFDFTVLDMVLMGRTPHKKSFEGNIEKDYLLARKALNLMGLVGMENRSFRHLSGGEQQRVSLARALVQEPNYLILDEPTNHLDIRYQLKLLSVVKTLGIGALAVLHDLNLAAQYCDYLYILKDGLIYGAGSPREVITETMLRDVYGVTSQVCIDEAGYPYVRYLPNQGEGDTW